MLNIQLAIASFVVVSNVAVTLWAGISHPPYSNGVGILLFGSCSLTSTLNSVLHVALNVISSLFLGAGNYCMQVLVAPSRLEIHRAHSRGVSLEIGVASVKNLLYIQRKRVVIWLLTGILATILHLL